MLLLELSHFLTLLLTHLLTLYPQLITFTNYHVMCRFLLENQDQDTGIPDPIFGDLLWLW